MSDDINEFKSVVLVIPESGKMPEVTLHMEATRVAESRFIEAKTVNPVTYVSLEHSFNESYRELKRNHATVGYQIVMAEKSVKAAKADVILGDKYAEFLKGKPKNADNADMREAFLTRDEAYNKSQDRLAQLRAVEAFIDGRIKVIENVCRYMRKEMDLMIRGGVADKGLYLGKK